MKLLTNIIQGKRAAFMTLILSGIFVIAALSHAYGNGNDGNDGGGQAVQETGIEAEIEIKAESGEYAFETEPLSIRTADGARHDFHVELAQTPVELQYGLMYRTEMPEDHGMLFIFPEESMRSFWMKNTLIPLDMIFIRTNGEIVNIQKDAQPNDLTSRPSTGPALAVLEINGGLSDKLGLAAGDVVYHSAFGNAPKGGL